MRKSRKIKRLKYVEFFTDSSNGIIRYTGLGPMIKNYNGKDIIVKNEK